MVSQPVNQSGSPCEWWSGAACLAWCVAAAAEDWLSPPWPVWSSDSASSGSQWTPGEEAGELQTNNPCTKCHTWLTQLHQVLNGLQARRLVNCKPTTPAQSVTHDWINFIRFSTVSRQTNSPCTKCHTWLTQLPSGSQQSPGEGAGELQTHPCTKCNTWLPQLHQVLNGFQARRLVNCKPTSYAQSVTGEWPSFTRFSTVSRWDGWWPANQPPINKVSHTSDPTSSDSPWSPHQIAGEPQASE